MGPLQYSGGFNFIFTVIDRASKSMKAIPLSDKSAAVCFSFFLDFLFWGARNNHFWSLAAIYFKYLVPALWNVTNFASPNNSLSSWVKRCSWKTAPPSQRCASRTRYCGNLGRGVTYCTPRSLCTAREDTGLSMAEAVFGTSVVLPNKFLYEHRRHQWQEKVRLVGQDVGGILQQLGGGVLHFGKPPVQGRSTPTFWAPIKISPTWIMTMREILSFSTHVEGQDNTFK